MTNKNKAYLYFGISGVLFLGVIGQIGTFFNKLSVLSQLATMSSTEAGELIGSILFFFVLLFLISFFIKKGKKKMSLK